MKKACLLFLIVAVSGLLAVAAQVNVTGDWSFTITTPAANAPATSSSSRKVKN